MTDVTAGRSAGTPRNADLDPMGRADIQNRQLASADLGPERWDRDPTAGRSAGTFGNAAHDPTAGRSAGTPANAERDPTAGRSAGTPANGQQDPTRSSFHQPRR